MATKKQQKNNQNRVLIPWNIGTRTHKSKKKYNRKTSKKELEKIIKE